MGHARRDHPSELDPDATAKAPLALIVAIGVLERHVFDEAALRTTGSQGERLIGLGDNARLKPAPHPA